MDYTYQRKHDKPVKTTNMKMNYRNSIMKIFFSKSRHYMLQLFCNSGVGKFDDAF